MTSSSTQLLALYCILDADGLSLDAAIVRGLESPTEVPPLLKSLYVVMSHLLRSPMVESKLKGDARNSITIKHHPS